MVQLGRYSVQHSLQFKCAFCKRGFLSRKALIAHCQHSSRHAWCERCSRAFRSEKEKVLHLVHSSAHWICSLCEDRPDFLNEQTLNEHLYTCHRLECKFCDSVFSSLEVLQAHNLDAHNACDECNLLFKNENNCRMHNRSHEPKNIKCFGCHKYFASYSAMLIHLEAGNCASGTDQRDINEYVYESPEGYFCTDGSRPFAFRCPQCNAEFSTVSGLFQHAETRPDCVVQMETDECLRELLNDLNFRILGV